MGLKTNSSLLPELSVIGEVSSPTMKQVYRMHPDGHSMVLPSVGGICYNFQIGDPAVGIAADHIEPGVSLKNAHDGSARALNVYSCIGNEAIVVSGAAKGKKGLVTGKHGGVEHVMLHFEQDVLETLVIGDKIQIRSVGCGLNIEDFPDIHCMSLSPWLLKKLKLKSEKKQLIVPVTHLIPAHLLGAGLGEDQAHSGDVDIQLFDEATVKEYKLDSLRFGDFVAMTDCDHSYGRIYRKDAISIGVVCHSCSTNAGHGPGITTILTSSKPQIKPVLDPDANLKNLFYGYQLN